MKTQIIPLTESVLVNENWQERAIAIRNRVVKSGTELKYLLSSEIHQFFNYELDNNKLMLYKILWCTGVRVGEVLELKVKDVTFDKHLKDYITVRTLKTKKTEYRQVDLDTNISHQLSIYIETNKLKTNDKLFNVTKRTVENWIRGTQQKAESDGVTFPITITPKVFRHSYAIHLLYNGYPEKIISKNLGHKRLKTTEIYTDILAIETANLRNIQF